MIWKHFLISAIYQEKEMLIDLAKLGKIPKLCSANYLLDLQMATWLAITGTLPCSDSKNCVYIKAALSVCGIRTESEGSEGTRNFLLWLSRASLSPASMSRRLQTACIQRDDSHTLKLY